MVKSHFCPDIKHRERYCFISPRCKGLKLGKILARKIHYPIGNAILPSMKMAVGFILGTEERRKSLKNTRTY